MTQYEKDIIWAASQFLYDDLPGRIMKNALLTHKCLKCLEDNAWKPFEKLTAGQWLWAHSTGIWPYR
jgi:hypothetical protein